MGGGIQHSDSEGRSPSLTPALTRVSLVVRVHLGRALGDLDLVDVGLEVERLRRVKRTARLAVAGDAVVVRVVSEVEGDLS